VADLDPPVEGRQRGRHGGRRVSLDEDPVGLLGGEDLVEGGQHPRGELAGRLVGPHQVEVDVRIDLEQTQDLIQHLAVLGRRAEPDGEALRLLLESANHRGHLDRFRTCADDDQNSLNRHEFLLIDGRGLRGFPRPLPPGKV
jgi:hypothetical protein